MDSRRSSSKCGRPGPRQVQGAESAGVSIRGTAQILDEGATAVADAMSQAKRYGENPAPFARQPRISFRISVERLTDYR